MSRKELEAMFSMDDLKQTRCAQELMAEIVCIVQNLLLIFDELDSHL
ncbi:MAG: hypothetical protein F6K54_13785 [Okeania sp. SIO3B5]|nr:hypothetical protein [Okeania sp. SIO3B5]NEO54053.1 hypothetical protein [Okeania sp. SIO3B5]